MNRRSLLMTSGAALVGLAGCRAGQPGGGDTGEAEFTLRTTDGDHEATATFGEGG